MDIMAYLAQASPDDWHQVAMQWNWDEGLEPLAWITRQPQCDRGTALLVYWGLGPRYFAQFAKREEVPAFQHEGYDLMLAIERAYVANGYPRREIAFDPRGSSGTDWTVRHAHLPARRHIPADMYLAAPGRTPKRQADFEQGYPPGVEPTDHSRVR